TPAQPTSTTGTSTVPAISATPATPSQTTTTGTSATDTTPPVISAISVTSISNTCATIGWNANEPAGGEVEYGLTSAYGSTAKDPTLRNLNAMGLCLFNSGTTYHFRIKSTDGNGNVAFSNDQIFTTTSIACSASSPGVPSCLTATLTSSGTGVILQWLIVGTVIDTKVYRRVATESPFYRGAWSYIGSASQNSTTYTDNNVSSGSYEYYVSAYNTSGGSAISNFVQITIPTTTTTDTMPPVANTITIQDITASSATFMWYSNEPAYGQVDYGTSLSYTSNKGDQSLSNFHQIKIEGLQSSTNYYYSVGLTDAGGNFSLTPKGSFFVTTASTDTIPPSVTITGPSPPDFSSCTVHVEYSVSDNVAIIGLQAKWDGVNVGAEFSLETKGSSVSTASNCYNKADGVHTYSVTARDGAGNITTKNITFTLPLAGSSTATSTSSLNPRSQNLSTISQMLTSLNEILKELSRLLR
ncbi:MAG: peptidase S8/S53 subtilisin kexin sedolisin, partial [Microgenomates group bacterium Gr01-1014_80]